MKPKKSIIILIVLILGGGLYVYAHYFLMPQWQLLKQTSSLYAERQAYLERLENNDLAVLEKQVAELSLKESDLRNSLPPEIDKPDILLTVYNLAKDNGVSPQTLDYEPIKDEAGFFSMGMTFTCTGPLEKVFALVEQLRKETKYILIVDSMNLAEREGDYAVTMRLVAHLYK